MPKLIIDNQEIQVPKGTKVIDAAEQMGIIIPRFCYHPGLGNVGACRMCAVVFKEGPVKGLEMSCMIDAQEGMIVSTTDPEAVAFRKWIIECLMMHHPHDCPVCDEGGHCLLQDETVSGGHGIRRYEGKKRTYRDQYLGEFIQHEMNRCIHCWRCRRFYQEFAGYGDLGALQIANRTFFGRFADGPLESPFSGNIIDLCPTGVFTDKPSRYEGRRWDFERHPSLCIHCSLGCNTTGSARYRKMVRLEARFNGAVNGYFICDRGRYGFQYCDHTERPRQARVKGQAVPRRKGLEEAAAGLAQIVQRNGPKAVACVGSARCSLETQGRIMSLCRSQGWREPAFFVDSSTARKTGRVVSRLDSRLAASMKEIEAADFILVLNADPVNEAPMVVLAMRQAFRHGAKVVVMDPRPVFLPMPFGHVPVLSEQIPFCMGVLLRNAVSPENAEEGGAGALEFFNTLPTGTGVDAPIHDRLLRFGKELAESRHPLLICGTDIADERMPDLAADAALLLRSTGKDARLFSILPGPNAFGAALLSSSSASFEGILEGIGRGEIKALLMVETDFFSHFRDSPTLSEVLRKLDIFILLDYLPSFSAEKAHVLLPTATLFEKDSHWINNEGRLQKSSTVHLGGLPIRQTRGGSHPPRIFMTHVPGGEPKPAGRTLAELSRLLSGEEDEPSKSDWRSLLSEAHPLLKNIVFPEEESAGVRVIPDEAPERDFSSRLKDAPLTGKEGEFDLLLVDWTFGTEELSQFSSFTRRVERAPVLTMHERDAAFLSLSSGDRVILQLPGGPVNMEIQTASNSAPGALIMPRHSRIEWQKAHTSTLKLPAGNIIRVST
jgi:NADH-quinone oxidoreductase subunit G